MQGITLTPALSLRRGGYSTMFNEPFKYKVYFKL
jgi:hypothetical protein